MVCSRSPWATASIVRDTSVVGHKRSSISELTEFSMSSQAPVSGPKRDALARLALLADDLAHALELVGHALVGRRRYR